MKSQVDGMAVRWYSRLRTWMKFKLTGRITRLTPVAVRSFASTTNEATFQTRPYKLFKLEDGPKSEAQVSRTQALDYYRKMQVIRR